MKTKEYVKKYKLDTQYGFNHSDFIIDLTADFMATLQFLATKNQLSYNRFLSVVKESKQKFDSISYRAKAKTEVWKKLWNFFYASVVVHTRDARFSDYLKKKQQEKADYDFVRMGGIADVGHQEIMDKLFEEALREHMRRIRDMFNIPPMIHAQYVTCTKKDFELLGLENGCAIDEVKKAYKQKALAAHPDAGGSDAAFIKLTEAKNRILLTF